MYSTQDEVRNLSLLMQASSCNGVFLSEVCVCIIVTRMLSFLGEDVILVGDFNMHPDDQCKCLVGK